MKRIRWGVSHNIWGVFDELSHGDFLEHDTIIHRVFCSCGWNKTIPLPYKTQGFWTRTYNRTRSVNFQDISTIKHLCQDVKHHWYCYFDAENKTNRETGITSIRATILFEDKSEAMITRLSCDYGVTKGSL